MTDLTVIVPSRGRPQRAAELARCFHEMSTAGNHLLFAVDSDDPTLPDYSPLFDNGPVDMWVCGPWQPMVPKLNQVATMLAKDDPTFALAFMGDDHRPRTRGWDSIMLTALRRMGTGVVYGDDLIQGERLCTSWMMTTNIVDELQRMVPAPVEHLFCDNAVMALARGADCLRYLPNVTIEHMHPLADKAEWDPGYARVNHLDQYRLDGSAFAGWQDGQMAADVRLITALIERGGRDGDVRNSDRAGRVPQKGH